MVSRDEEKRKRSLANLRPIPKGVTLNPTGRKAVPAEVKAVLEAATVRAAQVLVELMEDRSPKIRLAASQTILDRVHGKATQQVDVQVTDVAKVHLQALQEINARKAKRLELEAKPDVIDVTPVEEEDDGQPLA